MSKPTTSLSVEVYQILHRYRNWQVSSSKYWYWGIGFKSCQYQKKCRIPSLQHPHEANIQVQTVDIKLTSSTCDDQNCCSLTTHTWVGLGHMITWSGWAFHSSECKCSQAEEFWSPQVNQAWCLVGVIAFGETCVKLSIEHTWVFVKSPQLMLKLWWQNVDQISHSNIFWNCIMTWSFTFLSYSFTFLWYFLFSVVFLCISCFSINLNHILLYVLWLNAGASAFLLGV